MVLRFLNLIEVAGLPGTQEHISTQAFTCYGSLEIIELPCRNGILNLWARKWLKGYHIAAYAAGGNILSIPPILKLLNSGTC